MELKFILHYKIAEHKFIYYLLLLLIMPLAQPVHVREIRIRHPDAIDLLKFTFGVYDPKLGDLISVMDGLNPQHGLSLIVSESGNFFLRGVADIKTINEKRR